jgi:hypothetical protein
MTDEIIQNSLYVYCKPMKDENKEGSGKDGKSCEVGKSSFPGSSSEDNK